MLRSLVGSEMCIRDSHSLAEKDKAIHEFASKSDRTMRKMQALLEDKDLQLQSALQEHAGPDIAAEMMRLQKLLKVKETHLKKVLERTVGPDMARELLNVQQLLAQKQVELEEALDRNEKLSDARVPEILGLHELIREKDKQAAESNYGAELRRLQELVIQKDAQLAQAIETPMAPNMHDELTSLKHLMSEKDKQLDQLGRELRRLTMLLEDKDVQLKAAAAGPELQAELDKLQTSLDRKSQELKQQSQRFEKEMRALQKLLEDKSNQLRDALEGNMDPDTLAEIQRMHELLRLKDGQLEQAGLKSRAGSFHQDKETTQESSDLLERLRAAEAQVEELLYQLEVVCAEKEQLLEQDHIIPAPVELTAQHEDWETRCKGLEQRIRLQQKEQKMKLKRERWTAAEKIFRGIKNRMTGNPRLLAFQAWQQDIAAAHARVKSQRQAVKQMIQSWSRQEDRAVVAAGKIWVKNFTNFKLDASGRDSGLRLIRSVLKKWEQQRLSCWLTNWSQSYMDHKMDREKFQSGMRGMAAVVDKWRKSLFKAIIMNWRAKRKVQLTKHKEKTKRDGALRMMDQSTKQVQDKVMLMIKHSEEKANQKLKSAKKEVKNLEVEVMRLRDENEQLRLQVVG
eukprot:TRINITY_DN29022_c0_g1_i1.p1 TRINITY_DN29022_c0_g1~~TRINITY_DN29022_c0_g1_i1.p1  ORF type:complete len:625 (-),score=189.21 TRINITY_DN29022_c0_g1_i1:363-2237(-)